ncbi:hypothetical protein ABZX88_01960 [Kitasatospora aureofaciens]|uniref:hypothetical protein n=1 Tax=Kitasatospora aureofaciens TaxID=1894 RepID=UPI0033ABD67F
MSASTGEVRLHGRAADEGQVFQARGDQYITQVSFSLADGSGSHSQMLERAANAQQTRVGYQQLVDILLGMVASLEADRSVLKEKARRAKAEGRAEALEEIQGMLRGYELKLMQTQARLKEAQHEREVAERLLIETQRAAEEYRRAAEDLAQQRQASAARSAIGQSGLRDLHTYDVAMESVDAGLEALRTELRRLSNEMSQRLVEPSDRIVSGDVVDSRVNSPDWKLPTEMNPQDLDAQAEEGGPTTTAIPSWSADDALPIAEEEGDDATTSDPSARGRSVASRSVSGFLLTALVFLLPPVPLAIAGTSIRLTYSADPLPAVIWGLLFTIAVSLVGTGIGLLLMSFGRRLAGWGREDDKTCGCFFYALLSIGLFIYSLVRSPSEGGMLVTVAHFVATTFGPL